MAIRSILTVCLLSVWRQGAWAVVHPLRPVAQVAQNQLQAAVAYSDAAAFSGSPEAASQTAGSVFEWNSSLGATPVPVSGKSSRTAGLSVQSYPDPAKYKRIAKEPKNPLADEGKDKKKFSWSGLLWIAAGVAAGALIGGLLLSGGWLGAIIGAVLGAGALWLASRWLSKR